MALCGGAAEGGTLVCVGSLRGALALWRLADAPGADADPDPDSDPDPDPDPESDADADADADLYADDADAPRFWRRAAVVRWLREYVTRVPDTAVYCYTLLL